MNHDQFRHEKVRKYEKETSVCKQNCKQNDESKTNVIDALKKMWRDDRLECRLAIMTNIKNNDAMSMFINDLEVYAISNPDIDKYIIDLIVSEWPEYFYPIPEHVRLRSRASFLFRGIMNELKGYYVNPTNKSQNAFNLKFLPMVYIHIVSK